MSTIDDNGDERDPLERGPLPDDSPFDEEQWKALKGSFASLNAARRQAASQLSEAEREARSRENVDHIRAELQRIQDRDQPSRTTRRWMVPVSLAATLLIGFTTVLMIPRGPAPDSIYRGETQTLPSVPVEDPRATAAALVAELSKLGIPAKSFERDEEWFVEADLPADRMTALRKLFADAGVPDVPAGPVQIRFRVRLPDEAPPPR